MENYYALKHSRHICSNFSSNHIYTPSLPVLFDGLSVRQIDNEEYGEALSLAHAYNLDSDLVYQRQWRKSTVSIASIQDYLVRGEAGDEAAIDRRVKMSQEAEEEEEEEGRKMKHCSSLAVYPTLLDVMCACASACC